MQHSRSIARFELPDASGTAFLVTESLALGLLHTAVEAGRLPAPSGSAPLQLQLQFPSTEVPASVVEEQDGWGSDWLVFRCTRAPGLPPLPLGLLAEAQTAVSRPWRSCGHSPDAGAALEVRGTGLEPLVGEPSVRPGYAGPLIVDGVVVGGLTCDSHGDLKVAGIHAAALTGLLSGRPRSPDRGTAEIRCVLGVASSCYVEREGDGLLVELLPRPRTFPYVLEPGRSGKSSLMVRLHQEALRQNLRAVYMERPVDSVDSYEQFAEVMACQIVDALGLEPELIDGCFSRRGLPGRNLTVLVERILAQEPSMLVLLIDDVDQLLARGWGEQFLALLRSWHGRGVTHPELWGERFNVVLAGSSQPHWLIKGSLQSPFNVGTRVTLDDFDLAELERLCERYELRCQVSELQRLHELLAGHPAMTNRVVFVAASEGASIDSLCAAAATSELFSREIGAASHVIKQAQQVPALRRVLDELARDLEEDIGDPEETSLLQSLYRLGALRRLGARSYTWRCRLYQGVYHRI